MWPLVRFILPVIGGSLFQQLYNTVDFVFVGNFMDKTAAAAVGASATLTYITVGMFLGISAGCNVVAAQAIGEKDHRRAEEVLHTSVSFGVIAGVIVMLLGILLAPPILAVLHTPESAIPQAVRYLRIYLLSLPMAVFYNMVSGCMRAEGDSRSPFLVLASCGLLNVALDALFVVGLRWGVEGTAAATVLAQGASAVLVGLMACGKTRAMRLQLQKLRIHREVLQRILFIGLPTGVQTTVITISNIIFQYFINGYGETAVAAFATYYKVENLVYLAILAFGQAAISFAGQNVGAGNIRRLRKGILFIAVLGAVVSEIGAISILVFSQTVFRWFMKDLEVIAVAVELAALSFPFYFIYPFQEVYGAAVRAMGHAFRSLAAIVVNQCILRIVLLALFTGIFHTVRSLATVYPITWATAAATYVALFYLLLRQPCCEKSSRD